MSRFKFFLYGLLVFAAVGPIVPMTIAGIDAAVTTGIASKLLAPMYLAIPSYFIGIPIALVCGSASTALLLLFTEIRPNSSRGKRSFRLSVAVILSAAVVIGISVGSGSLRQSIEFLYDSSTYSEQGLATYALYLWRSQSTNVVLFGVPTLICNAIVIFCVWPRLEEDM